MLGAAEGVAEVLVMLRRGIEGIRAGHCRGKSCVVEEGWESRVRSVRRQEAQMVILKTVLTEAKGVLSSPATRLL